MSVVVALGFSSGRLSLTQECLSEVFLGTPPPLWPPNPCANPLMARPTDCSDPWRSERLKAAAVETVGTVVALGVMFHTELKGEGFRDKQPCTGKFSTS